MNRRSRTIIILVVVLAAVVGGAMTVRRVRGGGAQGPQVAGEEKPVVRLFRDPVALPAFSIRDLDGRQHSSSEWAGKVVLVNFWATWCPPCRAEIPDLIALQERYRDRVVVVGVSEDEIPAPDVKRFVDEHKMNYVVAMVTPELRKIFRGVVALPTTFVIGPDGRLSQKHVGLVAAAVTDRETRVLAGLAVNASVERIDNADKVRLSNAAQAKTIPGVDLSKLGEAERQKAVQALIQQDCTCGCGLTVAECRLEDPDCPVSLPLARSIVSKFANAQ